PESVAASRTLNRAAPEPVAAPRPVGAAGGYDSGECGVTVTSPLNDPPPSLPS
nr:hypothetical protein [Tanacetum cinerariifolium]